MLIEHMQFHFFSLDEVAASLSTTPRALLQAAELGEITLVKQSHGEFVAKPCPPGLASDCDNIEWFYVSCIPVPSYAISEMLAKGHSEFSRFERPGVDGEWFEVSQRNNIDDELIVHFRQEDLEMTGFEVERISKQNVQGPFDFFGSEISSRNTSLLIVRDLQAMLDRMNNRTRFHYTSGATEKKEPPAHELETSRGQREKHDISGERGARRMILENWDAVEKLYGPDASARQVLQVIRRNGDQSEKIPSFKTVLNKMGLLRKANLIPCLGPRKFPGDSFLPHLRTKTIQSNTICLPKPPHVWR